jgi:hypothetical protein
VNIQSASSRIVGALGDLRPGKRGRIILGVGPTLLILVIAIGVVLDVINSVFSVTLIAVNAVGTVTIGSLVASGLVDQIFVGFVDLRSRSASTHLTS